MPIPELTKGIMENIITENTQEINSKNVGAMSDTTPQTTVVQAQPPTVGAPGNDNATPAKAVRTGRTKPRLNMAAPIHALVKDSEAVLSALGFYYQRSGEIVYPFVLQQDIFEGAGVSRKRFSIIIKTESEFSILRRLASHAHCFKRDAKGVEYWSDPPIKLAQHLHDHAAQSPEECPYPRLSLVSSTPVLMPDGSVLEKGYSNEVFVRPLKKYPAIPDTPTKDDAIAALKKFEELYQLFPFKAEEGQAWNRTPSYAAVLAASLSLVARPALPTVPLFGITSPTPGTGKSLIAQTISTSMLGHKTTGIPFKDEEEFDKLLVPVLRAADRIVSIENLSRPLQSDHLTHAISDGIYKTRILGKSEEITLANRAVWFATGTTRDQTWNARFV